LRAFATRICILATRRIALRRLADPRFLRLRLRCAFRSAFSAFLPWFAVVPIVWTGPGKNKLRLVAD
jgi:hypothetical protein